MWRDLRETVSSAACAGLLSALGSLGRIDLLGMATAQQGKLSAAEKKTIEFGLVRLHTLDEIGRAKKSSNGDIQE